MSKSIRKFDEYYIKKLITQINLFESDCLKTYETFRFYVDYLIKTILNNFKQNVNEQD